MKEYNTNESSRLLKPEPSKTADNKNRNTNIGVIREM
jgi:hypothetical protein